MSLDAAKVTGPFVVSLCLIGTAGFVEASPLGSPATAVTGVVPAKSGGVSDDKSIRPFRIRVPEEDLTDLRRRVVATRWPERETVGDQSQGVQLARLQALVR